MRGKVLRLISRIFNMSEPPKKLKLIQKRRNLFLSDTESLKKLSQEELINEVLRLEEYAYHLKNTIKKKNPSGDSSEKTTKKFNFDEVPKRHVLLKFFYLGWDFQGFVVQENTNDTIEEKIIEALEKCTLIGSRETCNYQRCGRTDKGVSALSQVISLDVRSKLSEPTPENVKDEYPYCQMLNRLLPAEIQFYAWAHVSSDTSARFNCSSRVYKYYFPKGNLNIEMMQKASKFLLGTHDFRNFCKMDVGNGITTFVRHVNSVDIRPCSFTEKEKSGYQMFEFVIEGNAFLYHQIRYIMSVLCLIGQGKESPDIINRLLDVRENPCKPQYNLAAAFPLNLFDVDYANVNCWNTDENALFKTLRKLQNQWTECNVKCTMIRDMFECLSKRYNNSTDLENQTEPLLSELNRKTYKPLLKRPVCSSLEERIEYYVKKGKFELQNS